jgi:hypothetical protein
MSEVFKVIMSLMSREQLLQRFKQEVTDGKAGTIEVFLKKGTEYIVRGRVLKNSGTPLLSCGDVNGFTVPTHYGNGNGKYFSVIPEKDGPHYIRAAVKPAAVDQESATVMVTLSRIFPARLSW